MAQRSILLLILGLCCCAACDRNAAPPMVPVSGTVNLEGKPLAEGVLYFKTVETGALERFDISNGAFEGKAQVGKRRVEVIANQKKVVEIDGKDVEVPENIIDPSFNLESTLTAEVTLEGPNQFKFEVRRK